MTTSKSSTSVKKAPATSTVSNKSANVTKGKAPKVAEPENEMKAITTVGQLKAFISKASKGGMTLVRKSDGIALADYEKTAGKTEADAISYNEGTGKVRVAFMYRFFELRPAKATKQVAKAASGKKGKAA